MISSKGANPGHRLKSPSVKPVVVRFDTAWNAARRKAPARPEISPPSHSASATAAVAANASKVKKRSSVSFWYGAIVARFHAT